MNVGPKAWKHETTKLFVGDLHNHCGISYGHGTLGDALANARQQLDFCSVTGHAAWPDMPAPTPDTQHIIDFHERGFRRLREQWAEAMAQMETANTPGQFVTFPGFEVHSCEYGDRTVVLKCPVESLPNPDSYAALVCQLRQWQAAGLDAFCIPHHIAYRRGFRGIDWSLFDSECAPVVEIVSMHGCSENDDTPIPYLHVMGPSDGASTMATGLAEGHFFGVMGSTDHHAAHPGSYGYGRTGVWATECTRDAIWEGIQARRTYALTGDRIELRVALNGHPMGSRLAFCRERTIDIQVIGGAPIDAVDVIKNGALLRRFSECDRCGISSGEHSTRTRILLELGWGARERAFKWQGELRVMGGRIHAVEPRFRGREVLAPQENGHAPVSFHESTCCQPEADRVEFRTVTRGNPTVRTDSSQGICLHTDYSPGAVVTAVLNGQPLRFPLSELMKGAQSGRIGEMESPSYRLARVPAPEELAWRCRVEDTGDSEADDVYWVRVRQKNNQWAWSSPIRVDRQVGD